MQYESKETIMNSKNKLNRKLVNPTNFQIQEITDKSSYYEILQKIYDMAYELLCQTIGEENIKAPIDIYTVAEKLGFRIIIENNRRDFFNRAIKEIKKQNLGNLPYIELYPHRELDLISELVIKKSILNDTNTVDLTIIDLEETSIRYSIALAIAQLYFAKEEDFTTLVSDAKYGWGLNMLNSPRSLIERLFAYALLAPDKIMLKESIDFRNDNSRWPLDFAELINAYVGITQMPEYHVIWMFQYWKDLRTYKYMQTLSKNKSDNNKSKTSSIPKASLLNKFEADVFGLSFLEQTAKCSPLDYAIILGSSIQSDYLDNDTYEYLVRFNSNKNVCCYWLDAPISEDTAYAVDVRGRFKEFNTNIRAIAVRPKFTWSEISSLCINIKKNENGILEAEYGYWPSLSGSKEQQVELEILYKNDELAKTELDYTVDYNELSYYENEFEGKKQLVYEYQGKKWVRTKIAFGKNREKIQLSNEETYKSGDIVWIQLEPLKLLVDEDVDVAATKNAIVAGIRYKDLNQYFEEYMSNELYRSALLLQQEKLQQEEDGTKLVKKLTTPKTTDESGE